MTLYLSCLGLGGSAQSLRLVYNWHDTSLPGSSAFANVYNETWTYAGDGREYAIIGSTNGTHFFDVTDTAHVVMVDYVPGAVQGPIVIHRDYKHYKHYLYMVCDEGLSTLQIADMSYLPDSVHVVYDSDSLFHKSHNIFVDTARGRLYTLSESKVPGTFHALGIYSLADPENPVLLGHWDDVGHVHDAYVRNDTAFCNSGFEGLWVMNFSNPSSPQLIMKLDVYQDQGYNHSGWWSADRRAYLFADETHGMRMKSCATDDLANLEVRSLFGSLVDTNSIPHNLLIRDSLAYVSYYHDGLWIFDITDVDSLTPVAHYDTYPWADHDSYRGAWGVNPLLPSGLITVSDMQTGLYVFDLEYPSPSGDKAVSASELALFPNPCRDRLTILVPGSGQVSVRDLQGRVWLVEDLQGRTRVLEFPSTMPGGLYLVEVRTASETFAALLIKQ